MPSKGLGEGVPHDLPWEGLIGLQRASSRDFEAYPRERSASLTGREEAFPEEPSAVSGGWLQGLEFIQERNFKKDLQ